MTAALLKSEATFMYQSITYISYFFSHSNTFGVVLIVSLPNRKNNWATQSFVYMLLWASL